MIEFNVCKLSEEHRSTVRAYSHIVEASWKAEYAIQDTRPEYDDVYNILIEASCRLRAAREKLRHEVDKIASSLGAKTHEVVSFVSKETSGKRVYATIIVEDNGTTKMPPSHKRKEQL